MHQGVDLTLGILFIATMIAASLWGVSCLQTYSYFNSYQHDRRLLKSIVIAAWCLDTLHQALISHANYFYLVTNRGDISIAARVVWSVHAQSLISPALAFIVQSFFVFRIWKLSKQDIVITTPVAVSVLAQLISNVTYFCEVFVNRLYEYPRFSLIEGLFIARETLTATSDVFLAITLTYLLRRSRTGFQNCDTKIKRLIVYTINTGLVTSLNAVCSLIAALAGPGTFIFILFYFITARLYFNSLMANLNVRKIISGDSSYAESDSLGSLRAPNRTGASSPLSFAKEGQATHNISVKIDTVLETRGESYQTASDDCKSVVV